MVNCLSIRFFSVQHLFLHSQICSQQVFAHKNLQNYKKKIIYANNFGKIF